MLDNSMQWTDSAGVHAGNLIAALTKLLCLRVQRLQLDTLPVQSNPHSAGCLIFGPICTYSEFLNYPVFEPGQADGHLVAITCQSPFQSNPVFPVYRHRISRIASCLSVVAFSGHSSPGSVCLGYFQPRQTHLGH